MIRRLEGLAAAPMCGPRENALVHLQIRLKFESGACIPMLLASERGEEFAAKGGSVFVRQGFESGFASFGRDALADKFEGVSGHGEQRFALQQSEKIAVQRRMHLQGVTALLDYVGIDEAGDDALAFEAFTQAFREFGGATGRIGFGLCYQREAMLAGVEGGR